MLKNRLFVAFAFAGLVGFAACADEPEVVEEPVVEEPMMEPTTEPAPMTTDTALMPLDTAGMDTTADLDTAGI